MTSRRCWRTGAGAGRPGGDGVPGRPRAVRAGALPQHFHTDPEPLSVEGSLAGRCFRQVELQNTDDGRRVWVPLLNGLERLGVLELGFPNVQQRAPDEQLHAFAALISELSS